MITNQVCFHSTFEDPPMYSMNRGIACLVLCGCVTLALVSSVRGDPLLKVTEPADGESWSVGSQHYVTWTSTGLAGDAPLQISLSSDGGDKWKTVAHQVPNSGKFLWKVPGILSTTCKIRLTEEGGRAVDNGGVFRIVPSQEVADYEWVNVTPRAAFAPRDGAGALVFQGKMWLLGGWNPSDKVHFPRICNNEVWSTKDGAAWTLEKPNTFRDASFRAEQDWEGRHTAGYAVFKDKMWILGGDANQGHYQSDVWNSSDGRTWTRVAEAKQLPWCPRVLHYTVVFRDKLWVIGGQTMSRFAPAPEALYRDVWNSADGVHWQTIVPAEPCWAPRGMIGGSVVLHDRIWVLGGGTYDTVKYRDRSYHNDVWSTADGAVWKRHLTSAPWEARQYHDVAAFDGRMWVLEGFKGGNHNDVWYSTDGSNWYELPATPWKPRHAASVFVHDNALWMVAGNNMESDVWKLQRRTRSKQQGGGS
jgi:hypothetical protein